MRASARDRQDEDQRKLICANVSEMLMRFVIVVAASMDTISCGEQICPSASVVCLASRLTTGQSARFSSRLFLLVAAAPPPLLSSLPVKISAKLGPS